MEKGLASFEERSSTEKQHLGAIKDYLYAREETVGISDATDEEQIEKDIDLHWMRVYGEKVLTTSVELKVDTQGHETGNLAFETVSNEIRGTRGCFMRSEADLLFYYLAGSGELWVMDMALVRKWFIEELGKSRNRFRSFETYTQLSGGQVYPSYGRLVPIEELKAVGKLIGLKYAKLK